MALRKTSKKVYKKHVAKQKYKAPPIAKRQRAIAFLVGVATVIILGAVFINYATHNNYTEILGEKNYIEEYPLP